ncbi:type IV secretory system conjugative DNA transfer family protein [Campylobacter upsaliensis]|nr:type IV secretory system conjugative DNA transfer family protein [Campylobacter upsaliensis]
MKKTSLKEWLKRFAFALLLGIVIYFLSIFIIFKPHYTQLLNIGFNIIQNLGHPYLKIKAYLCLVYALMPFILMFLWFLFHKENKMEEYGNAEFAKLEEDKTGEIWKAMDLSKEKGLMLGCFIDKKEQRTYIRALKPLACLIVAPPGTGKTASIALPNLYSLPNSCVVLDIKGELYEKSAGYRQKHFNNEILLFSPFSEDNTLFFNPFDKSVIKDLDFIQRMKLAEQIAGTIFVGEKGKENDHWVVSARTLFTYFAMYFMSVNHHTSLAELAQCHKKDYYYELKGEFLAMCQKEDDDSDKMVRDPEVDSFIPFLKQTSLNTEIDELIRNQFRTWSNAAEQEFAGVKSTFDTFMKVFANPQIAKAVSTMNFNYEDLRERKITAYVVIQTADMDILAPLVRIFVESLFKNLMMREESNPDKFIYFLLDEFVRFGKMPFLLEAPALCRSYGLIPVYITQSYEQIKKYYGDDDLKIIKANVGYQVVFRMNSPEDAKVLSEMIGDFTRKKISKSQGNLDFVKHSNSISHEAYKLVTVQDILSNPLDQIYILIGGFFNRPIKAKVNFWFKNPKWQGADKIPLLRDSTTQSTAQPKDIPQLNNNQNDQEQNTTQDNAKEQESQETKKEEAYNPFRIYKEKPKKDNS